MQNTNSLQNYYMKNCYSFVLLSVYYVQMFAELRSTEYAMWEPVRKHWFSRCGRPLSEFRLVLKLLLLMVLGYTLSEHLKVNKTSEGTDRYEMSPNKILKVPLQKTWTCFHFYQLNLVVFKVTILVRKGYKFFSKCCIFSILLYFMIWSKLL